MPGSNRWGHTGPRGAAFAYDSTELADESLVGGEVATLDQSEMVVRHMVEFERLATLETDPNPYQVVSQVSFQNCNEVGVIAESVQNRTLREIDGAGSNGT